MKPFNVYVTEILATIPEGVVQGNVTLEHNHDRYVTFYSGGVGRMDVRVTNASRLRVEVTMNSLESVTDPDHLDLHAEFLSWAAPILRAYRMKEVTPGTFFSKNAHKDLG